MIIGVSCLWSGYLRTGTLRNRPKQLLKRLWFQGSSLSLLVGHGMPVFTFCWWEKNKLSVPSVWADKLWDDESSLSALWPSIHLQPCWPRLTFSASGSSSCFCTNTGMACITAPIPSQCLQHHQLLLFLPSLSRSEKHPSLDLNGPLQISPSMPQVKIDSGQ